MKLNKQTIIILVIAGVVLVVFLLLPTGPATKTKTTTKNVVADSVNISLVRKEINELLVVKDLKIAESNKGFGDRNPFVASRGNTVITEGFSLQGIFYGNHKPCAIINGKIVGVGDKIDGARVKDVTGDFVVLVDDTGKQIKLTLKTLTIEGQETQESQEDQAIQDAQESQESNPPLEN